MCNKKKYDYVRSPTLLKRGGVYCPPENLQHWEVAKQQNTHEIESGDAMGCTNQESQRRILMCLELIVNPKTMTCISPSLSPTWPPLPPPDSLCYHYHMTHGTICEPHGKILMHLVLNDNSRNNLQIHRGTHLKEIV